MTPKQQAQKLRSLRIQRQASLSDLTQILLNGAASKVDESMHAFRDHVFAHASQWAGVRDIPEKLTAALHEFSNFQLSINSLMSVEIHDAHNRALRKSILLKIQGRMETLVDELQYHVIHADKALDVEMERMHATIHHLQQFTEDGERRPSTSQRKQVMREYMCTL